MKTNSLDRVIGYFAPSWSAQRAQARSRVEAFEQIRAIRMQYDAASRGRRTNGWRTVGADANEIAYSARSKLRDIARDLVRNDPLAAKALGVISQNVVGRGIIPTVEGQDDAAKKALEARIKDHLETTDIDVAGKQDIYGLQALVMKTVPEAGECLIRRRMRQPKDGLAMPFQLQVMEPDFIDTSVNGQQRDGTFCVQGIAFSPIGKVEGYYLFAQHPGSSVFRGGSRLESRFIPAADIIHVFRVDRPGQLRGVSWFAPVIARLHDLGDFKDAHLMRQKIAACWAAFIKTEGGYTVDPTAPETADDELPLTSFEPGMIEHLKAGESVEFGTPPMVTDFDPYIKSHARDIAAGLGISYEALTGDLSGVNFSSGRMGWLESQRSYDAWRDYMLMPQMCAGVARWFLEAGLITDGVALGKARIRWTAPRRDLISPERELPAIAKGIRAGLTSRSEEQRKLGFDPTDLDNEIAEDNKRADTLGLVFDSDARKTSGAGLAQQDPAAAGGGSQQQGDPNA